MTLFQICMNLSLGLIEFSPWNTRCMDNQKHTLKKLHYSWAQKCHKLHKLDREQFKQLEELNRHLILPNFILLFYFTSSKYNNLVKRCWIVLLRMTILSAQHRLVIRQMYQWVADIPTSLEHCFFNVCNAICMFCDMFDLKSWFDLKNLHIRSRKSHGGGYWCTGDYLVLEHLQPSLWCWLGSASHMYSVPLWKDVVCKISAILSLSVCVNTLWQRQSDLYFEDDIFHFILNFRWDLI